MDPTTPPAADSAPASGIPPLSSYPLLAAVALLGFFAAISGTYWDDSWHTETGRDSFLIPPHIALYAGISAVGGAVSLWLLIAQRAAGSRAALRYPPLFLALLGVVVTLAAAPIDNAWHEAFGRDAVIWSPPHMLGVAGSLLIAAALLLEFGPALRVAGSRLPAVVSAAAVLAVMAVPVLEYETDVPQFDPAFYLPVLATGSAFALGLIRLALPLARAAAMAALVYTLVIAAIAQGLLAGGHSAPLIPLLFLPALALDAVGRRGLAMRALAYVGVLYLAYVPYLNWIRSDLQLDGGDVLLGLPIAVAGAALALALTSAKGIGRSGRAATSTVAAALIALLSALPALAHDPGQGEELTTATITVEVSGDVARFGAVVEDHCGDLEPRRLIARRAGVELGAPLQRGAGACSFSGTIEPPDRGRWFLYAELEHEGRAVETWLAVGIGSDGVSSDVDRSVYEPSEAEASGLKTLTGIVVYGLFFSILLIVPHLYRRRLGPGAGA